MSTTKSPVPKPSYLSARYWSELSEADQHLYAIVRPQPHSTYKVDVALSSLEDQLSKLQATAESSGGTFELNPDFQRGHVWTDTQRMRYVESFIRGYAPRTTFFNCPGWNSLGSVAGDIPAFTIQCIDGLQRITALRRFMAGDFPVFGAYHAADLQGTPFDPRRMHVQIQMFEFANRFELLSFYLDINGAGTVHGQDELDRVQALRDAAARSSQ